MADETPIMIPAWVDGTLTPVEKLAVHQRGLRHKAVSVFVVRDGKVLLQRRALEKYHTPGLWANTCCTHPHWGEAAQDCGQRRVKEELGITGLSLAFRQQVEYRADVGGGLTEHEVVDLFVAEAADDMPLVPNPDEVMDTEWIAIRALKKRVAEYPERYTPWLRIYLEDHAQVIFG
ncbi:isopentenyl-diphosphate Delta-isomerase [Pacificoceanicola onchidii]|uniref:isopentenyl-diphosphate Delta-isomerase n=1 Tax=Pacificoceanicola onchidii TaxID=2562685 RepID=UPI001F10F33B|nr:isopentenyl-diphosphate Delta-isomerase [Pacificoceanicola onchidii]